MKLRFTLMAALIQHFKQSEMTQIDVAKVLGGVAAACVRPHAWQDQPVHHRRTSMMSTGASATVLAWG
jgi:hypothetical protein